MLQLGQHQLVIDGGEIGADGSLEHPAALAAGTGKAAWCAVGAVALADGVAGGAEAALQWRYQHGDQSVVHHPIPEGARRSPGAVGSRIVKRR